MSGITPLLDTLLHQVLGRRVDIPVPRDLNQPVAAPMPVEGARAVHSDSRLDARTLPQAPSGERQAVVEGAREALVGRDGQAPRHAPNPSTQPQGSTVTTFSAAARAIADVLQRVPLPPAAISPAAPLLSAADAPAGQVAASLQQSVERSGLFYESHVARWVRGELPLEALRHEPQMRQAPAVLASGGEAARAVPGESSAPSAAGPLPPAAALRAAAEPERPSEALPLPAEEGAAEPRESLVSLVRQQLELLAVPQLRWEGQVWAGLFMALAIELPAEGERPGGDQAADAEEDRPASEWRVRLGLQLSGHGELAADIRLQGGNLQLLLRSDSAALREHFRAGRDQLRASLLACGLDSVELRLDGEGVA
ncbi:flagellar hook-length control protein FliK [Pseudomonas stutzeri]|nr:flagellar hook-length control protein FliK [Stutzerimonas stutzeri]